MAHFIDGFTSTEYKKHTEIKLADSCCKKTRYELGENLPILVQVMGGGRVSSWKRQCRQAWCWTSFVFPLQRSVSRSEVGTGDSLWGVVEGYDMLVGTEDSLWGVVEESDMFCLWCRCLDPVKQKLKWLSDPLVWENEGAGEMIGR